MNRAVRRIAVAVVLALVAAACGSGDTAPGAGPSPATGSVGADTGPSTTATASAPDVTYRPLALDEAVAALDDPDTAVQGVLGILDELNIGVYTADGTPILAGSETGPDDLYVSAELLPGLAASARRPGPTMERYLGDLDQLLETGLTPAELAAVYTVMTETMPDHPMSRVLKTLGVTFEPDARLTRFEAWLLLVSWVPPNGAAARGGGPVVAVAAPAALYQVRCPATGDGSPPGYDLADQYGKGAADKVGDEIRDQLADGALGQWEGSSGSVTKVAGTLKSIGDIVGKLAKLIDIAKAAQVMVNVDFAVDAEPVSTHKPHSTKNETPEDKRVQITVTATFTGVTAATEGACAFAGTLGLPDPNTPIEGAQVSLLLDDTLAAHGYVRRRSSQLTARASTDENGQYIAWYEPKVEEPKSAQRLSDAFLRKTQGTFTISVTWGTALGQLFNIFGGADLVLDILGLNEIDGEITVGWHDPVARIRIGAPLVGFVGDREILLETCDGVEWTGTLKMDGTLTTPEGTMWVEENTPLSVTVPAGTTSGQNTLQFERTLDGQAAEVTFHVERTQTGTLRLELREDGMAKVDLDQQPGSQVIEASTPDGNLVYSTTLEGTSESYTVPIEPADCGTSTGR